MWIPFIFVCLCNFNFHGAKINSGVAKKCHSANKMLGELLFDAFFNGVAMRQLCKLLFVRLLCFVLKTDSLLCCA